ncbi:DUF4249 domain-containing protein [Mucilaginibacter phyllosphaerae]|nr:DUF4249 domain-containing protein [Mucilaginibacter phyllosphaerae]
MMLLLHTSCEKVIDVDIKDDTGIVVIEGNITDVTGLQTVKISRNTSFDNTNTYPAVSGATVKLNDQAGNEYQMAESQPGTYTYGPLAAIAGSTYTLSVSVDGKTYTATSTMPGLVALDSLSSRNRPTDDQERQVLVHYKDQAGISNQYRFVLFINGAQIKSVFAADDDFTDGRAVNTILRIGSDLDVDILPGDTATVEMQCIDKPVYTYWYSLMQQQSSGAFGSATPANPPSNLNNGALGYFSAHTTQTKTIIVK